MDIIDTLFSIPSAAASNLSEMGSGLRTAGAELIKPAVTFTSQIASTPTNQRMEAVKKAFKDTIGEKRYRNMATGAVIGNRVGAAFPRIGTLGGTIVGGLAGLVGPEDYINSILGTYNTSISDIASGKFNPKEAVKGALANPVYTAMDIAGIGGIGKSIGKQAKSGIKATGSLEQLFPGQELGEFNRELSNAKLFSQSKTADLYTGYNMLSRMPLANREQFVKQITLNNSKLSTKDRAVAEQIKKDLIANEKLKIELGELDPSTTRDNTIAQYVMGNVGKGSDLIHQDIMNIIQGKPLDTISKSFFDNKELGKKVLKLIDRGEELYDNGKIAFLSQELTPTKDPLGIRSARQINLENPSQYGYARIIGRASAKQQGRVLDDILKMQVDDVTKATQGIDIINDAMDSRLIGNLSSADKMEILDRFKKSISKDIQQGRKPNLVNALNNSGINDKINKNFYEALKGILETPTIGAGRRFLNNWKKVVLGNPAWVMGNRLGNWSNNAIEGVTLGDYADVVKYKKYMPSQLKQQTSYNSYVNIGNEILSEAKDVSGFKDPLTQLRRGWGRFSASNKTANDYLNLAGDLIGGSSNLVSNPFFKLESGFEFSDRAANYIRQAKREAKATGKSLENVLKSAQKDKRLFGKLNTKVNKSLGDYYGRNYAAPSVLRDVVGELIPFYRFPFQTARTTLHQVANRPAAFAANISTPARVGQDIAQGYIGQYNLNPEYYKGGTPYLSEDGKIKTYGLTPAPVGIIGERVADPRALAGTLNPLFNVLSETLEYKKFDRKPTSPTLKVIEILSPQLLSSGNRELINLVNNYKGTADEKRMLSNYLMDAYRTTGDRSYLEFNNYIGNKNIPDWFKYMINQTLSNTYAPYQLATRYAPGPAALVTGKGLRTFYDTDTFKQVPDVNTKKLPVELLGNWLGITSQGNTPIRPMSRREISRARNKSNRILQNILKEKGN